MKLRLSCLALASAALVISGCVSPTTVDYDRAILSKIQSYQCFVVDPREKRMDYQEVVLSPIVDRRIESALRAELIAKGYKADCPTPDFRVTFNTVTQTKSELHEFGMGASPFRHHPYFGYAGYSRLDFDQYEEGTFVVDIIDNESNQLVWRGAYAKRLGWSAPTDEEVREIIRTILSEFPPELAE